MYKNLRLDFNLPQSVSISASVLSPETWPFSLHWLPPAVYLVGGSVRDALLGRKAEYLDLDFVMPEAAVQTAKAIANHYRAGFVLLDAERQIARVVFEKATVDFAQQVGSSLEDDLQRRDFTVNAIAYNPHTDQLLDPLQGYADLQKHLLRMITPENLKEDPLRLLRAYRQAAQLGFTLESATQQTIQTLSNLLELVAAERVQGELNYLLNTSKGTPLLKLAWHDRLLQYWLPHATTSSLDRVTRIDEAASLLSEQWLDFGSELLGWVRDQSKLPSGGSRSWLKVAKLAALTAQQPDLAEQELWRLKYSRAEVLSVLAVIRFLPQLEAELLVPSAQYYLFRGVGAAFPALAVSAVAAGISVDRMGILIDRFLNPHDPIAHPTPPLTGRDLMQTLKLPPGPKIGQLLEALQLAQAEGNVTCRETALAYAQAWLSTDCPPVSDSYDL